MSDGMSSRPKEDGPSGLSDAARQLAEEVEAEGRLKEPFTGAIIFCPLCCSQVDATDFGVIKLECNNCTTRFAVDLKSEVVAQHAMYG